MGGEGATRLQMSGSGVGWGGSCSTSDPHNVETELPVGVKRFASAAKKRKTGQAPVVIYGID